MLPWTVQDSNLRPTGCKPDALPSELTVQSVARESRTRPLDTPISFRYEIPAN